MKSPRFSIKIAEILFLLMQVTIEFPYVFAQTLIYSTIFYSLASFEWTALKFAWYIFFMFFTLLYFTFFGMMTTAVTPNHNVAAIIAAPFYMLWNLFSGFMIPHKVMLSHFGPLESAVAWVTFILCYVNLGALQKTRKNKEYVWVFCLFL